MGNVLKEYVSPNGGKVTIMDDYITRDSGDIKKILAEISDIYTKAFGTPIVAFAAGNPPKCLENSRSKD